MELFPGIFSLLLFTAIHRANESSTGSDNDFIFSLSSVGGKETETANFKPINFNRQPAKSNLGLCGNECDEAVDEIECKLRRAVQIIRGIKSLICDSKETSHQLRNAIGNEIANIFSTLCQQIKSACENNTEFFKRIVKNNIDNLELSNDVILKMIITEKQESIITLLNGVTALTPELLQQILDIVGAIGPAQAEQVTTGIDETVKLINQSIDTRLKSKDILGGKACESSQLLVVEDMFQIISKYNWSIAEGILGELEKALNLINDIAANICSSINNISDLQQSQQASGNCSSTMICTKTTA